MQDNNNSDTQLTHRAGVICHLCQGSFPSRNKLFFHIKSAHGDLDKINTNKPEIVDVTVVNENPIKEIKEDEVALEGGLVFKISTPVPVAYEDANCRVIVKPQGLPTMGGKGFTLLKHPVLQLPENIGYRKSYRKANPCHRLDSATGGLVVCSKSKLAELAIFQLFRRKCLLKRYLAMLPGELALSSGFIRSKIEGKLSITYFRSVNSQFSKKYGKLSTLSLWPITGRRHQLRRQLAELGYPILGDPRYSQADSWPQTSPTLFLWAVELTLPDPNLVIEALNISYLDKASRERLISEESHNSDCKNEVKQSGSRDNRKRKSMAVTSVDVAVAAADMNQKREEEEDDEWTNIDILFETGFRWIKEPFEDVRAQIFSDQVGASLDGNPQSFHIEDYLFATLQRQGILPNSDRSASSSSSFIHVKIGEPAYYQELRDHEMML
jgi:23S rRNA-/tRNA-specific pseudouridylate synthase